MKINYKIRNFSICVLLFLLAQPVSLLPQIASLEATLKLNQVDGIYIPYQNGMPLPTFEKQNRKMISLNGVWKKERLAANDDVTLAKRDTAGYNNLIKEAGNRYLPGYDASAWSQKQIPSVENSMFAYPKVPEYFQDGVWYRYEFNADDSVKNKFVKLMFYSVNYVADVWLNGNYVGYHEGGYTPFAFDVSSKLNFGKANVLVVRVDNPQWDTRKDIVPYVKADWFNYAGIIHDVFLEVSDKSSVARADIVPLDEKGNLQTTVTVVNKNLADKNLIVKVEVFKAKIDSINVKSEKASDLVGSSVTLTGTSQTTLMVKSDSARVWRTNLTIPNPDLWSPKNPNLYIMKVTLSDAGTVVDQYYTQFGVRTVKTSNDKVLLNNNPVFLTGLARHEDHPVYGRSIPVDTIYTDMLKIKSLNANMLRTAHYPNHLYTYLLADRLGICIVEEIPVWWFNDAEAWTIQDTRQIHMQMFKEMVFRDYNRPSIILWSTTNECSDEQNRKAFIEKVKDEISTKYNDGRLITQSAAADKPGAADISMAPCDVAGWTMYFSVFYGGFNNYYNGTKVFIVRAQISNPQKPVLDTEFGTWSSEDGSTTQEQVNCFNETFRAFQYSAAIAADGSYNAYGPLMGITWWCAFDWYSAQHPTGYQSMGLYPMNRGVIKPVGTALKNSYAPYFKQGGQVVITGVNDNSKNSIVKEFNLEQNFPNPFNPSTVINWQIPAAGKVTLKLYNLLGKEIAVLLDEEKPAGKYSTAFSADKYKLSSGVYFYKLQSGNYTSTKKMTLLK